MQRENNKIQVQHKAGTGIFIFNLGLRWICPQKKNANKRFEKYFHCFSYCYRLAYRLDKRKHVKKEGLG